MFHSRSTRTASTTTPTHVLEAITDETRLVVICTPNNPTGNAMELADVRRIAETGVPFLLDAAYADFDPDRDPMHLVHEYDNVIVTRTFSKAYCLAGVRVGYAVGNAGALDYVDRFLVPGSSVSSPALHAGLAAFEDEAYHQHQIERITSERERLLPLLQDLGLRAYPSGGNFVAVNCSAPAQATSLAASVLEHGVVVRPLGSLVRISIGRHEENDALVAALASVVETEGSTVIPDGVRQRDLVGYGRTTTVVLVAGRRERSSSISCWSTRRGRRRPCSGATTATRAGASTPMPGVQPPRRDPGTEAHYEYGSRAGVWRLARIFDDAARARHRVCSGGSTRAEPRGARVDARAGPRSARSWVALDPSLGHASRRGARAPPPRDRELRAELSASGRSAGTARRGRASRHGSSSSRRAASSTTRTAAPTTFPYYATLQGAAVSRRPVLEDVQRQPLPDEPGVREPTRLPRHARDGARRARARGANDDDDGRGPRALERAGGASGGRCARSSTMRSARPESRSCGAATSRAGGSSSIRPSRPRVPPRQ